MNHNLRFNEQIRISPLRVIGPENEQIGVISNLEALRMARDAGMDLVEVAPNVRPPVCRIMDYGKWKYEQKKGQKKHHEQELKEVRLRPKTDTHDLEIKSNKALDFLREGDKVQFTMQFRGRERSHREIGIGIMNSILQKFGDKVKVERTPIMDGRNMIMIVSPNKAAFAKDEPKAGEGKGGADGKAPREARAADAAQSPRPESPQPLGGTTAEVVATSAPSPEGQRRGGL